MACTYADGLSSYENKGICGLPEVHDEEAEINNKVEHLKELILSSKHVVIHTGAGISTSAGIPDFRGPKGVWTLEKNGEKPEISISFNDAAPTATHMALICLVQSGYVHHIVSQNVDGLHLKSGLPGTKLSELHGNMFLDKCDQCNRQFVRKTAAETVGQKCSEVDCPLPKAGGRPCRGKLRDTILDWEDELPFEELEKAEIESRTSDLSICLGTTLQILPSGKLPLLCKKNSGKLVICNLQATKYDSCADLLIHDYVDSIMDILMKKLGMKIPEYVSDDDPTKKNPGCEFVKHSQTVKKCAKRDVRQYKNKNLLLKDPNIIPKTESIALKRIKVEHVPLVAAP